MKKLFILSALISVFCFAMQAQQKVYDFNDGTWGEVLTERPESGSFTSSTVNDVKFNNAIIFQKEGKGAKRVIVDKKSLKGSIEFPEFSNAKEVLIEASVGTDGKTFVLEEKVNGKWKAVGSPIELTKQKTVSSHKLSDGATQVRILNDTSSALIVYRVTIK